MSQTMSRSEANAIDIYTATLDWTYREVKDGEGEVATWAEGAFSATVIDHAGDLSTWTIKKDGITVEEGQEEFPAIFHFYEAQRRVEDWLKNPDNKAGAEKVEKNPESRESAASIVV